MSYTDRSLGSPAGRADTHARCCLNTVYTLAYLISFPILILGSVFSRKLRKGLLGRIGLATRLQRKHPSLPLFWFHVASSGEFEQAVPVMLELKQRRECEIFLSYFSPSGQRAVELEIQRRQGNVPWDSADYSPFDLPWAVTTAIKSLRPTAFISIHREMWPVLFSVLKDLEVPIYLFATYWPRNSQRRFLPYAKILEGVRGIGTVDPETRQFLKARLPDLNIDCLGDPRVERVKERKEHAKTEPPWVSFFSGQKVIVLGSVWREDLDVLLPALQEIAPNSQHRIVLVPHETSTRTVLAYHRRLSEILPGVRLWSQWLRSPDDSSHLVVDQVGFLAELYRIASFVFVGGSFRSRVHNVLEPATYAKPILTGPQIWNSFEATEMASRHKGLYVATGTAAISEQMQRWLSDPEALNEDSKNCMEYINTRLGASKRYVDVLLNASRPEI